MKADLILNSLCEQFQWCLPGDSKWSSRNIYVCILIDNIDSPWRWHMFFKLKSYCKETTKHMMNVKTAIGKNIWTIMVLFYYYI